MKKIMYILCLASFIGCFALGALFMLKTAYVQASSYLMISLINLIMLGNIEKTFQ